MDKLSADFDYLLQRQAVPQFRPLVLQEETSSDGDKIPIFIECDEDCDFSALGAHGVNIYQEKGRMRTGLLPLDMAPMVAGITGVRRITPAQLLKPRMDQAAPAVFLQKYRASRPLPNRGEGVVIGVVDSGLDWSHPAFVGRVERIWDQTLSGKGTGVPGIAPIGMELLPPHFGATTDLSGHGTHVASIAAGDLAPYHGIAPKAQLIIVKTTRRATDIADGIRFVFHHATTPLHRPAVVNLSFGSHEDPHDGTDPLSKTIDSLVGQGRIVVCAAGNEGDLNIHARTVVPAHGTAAVRLNVPIAVKQFVVVAWYTGALLLKVAMRGPSGTVTPPQLQGAASATAQLVDGAVFAQTPTTSPDNGDHEVKLRVAVLQSGTWQVQFENPGSVPILVDLWCIDRQDSVQFVGQSVSRDMKVGSPGSASSAITVGATVSRDQWTDRAGSLHRLAWATGSVPGFSSPGPLRQSTVGPTSGGGPSLEKPDVVAPGAGIVAALSAASAPSPGYLLLPPPSVCVKSGTSMAAPVVTGLVALMLQRRHQQGLPQFSPADLRAVLRANSSRWGQGHDPTWGYGLVDSSNI